MRIPNFLCAGIEVYKHEGLFHLTRSVFYSSLFFIFYKVIKQQNTFLFRDNKYHYFYSFVNKTWMNERCVEIPIVMEVVKRYHGKRILEVGNVLSNYFRFEHDIVDKYEIKSDVINEDAVSFNSTQKYDLIISISTLEHIGLDEELKDDMKIPRTIDNLKGLVNPNGGMIIVTLPLGYNPALDKLLKNEKIKFTMSHYLIRISKGNEWKEASWEDVQCVKYGSPFPAANGLVIGIIRT